jgi:hypothetical protein
MEETQMTNITTRARQVLAQLAAGAVVASCAIIGLAKADTDNISNQNQVLLSPAKITCATTGAEAFTNSSSFSFDISWVDAADRAYFLADRSNGTASADNQGGVLTGATNGDVLMIDINSNTVTVINPPTADPFAGVRCDNNLSFNTGVVPPAAGRNEITGPNGLFTVNHSEVWVGDGPSRFNPGQTNTAVDYAADLCNSSVRVFNLITKSQTDHINVGGCFRTDEGAFDPDDQVALFANPSEQHLAGNIHATPGLDDSPFITLISTVPQKGSATTTNAHKILKQINFDGTNGTILADMGVEQAVYSPQTGYFYVAIPGTTKNPSGYVVVVDPRHDGDDDADDIRVVRNFALTNNCAPAGAALGPDFELFLGCGNSAEQVIDIRSGHLIRSISGTSGGCDEVAFNAGDDHFAGACSDADATPGLFNIDISDADPVRFDQSLTTAVGAHSIAADPVTRSFWVPGFGVPGSAGTPSFACPMLKACVAIYSSTGGDDPSEFQQEQAEDHHRDH